jgi:hypothetical protein
MSDFLADFIDDEEDKKKPIEKSKTKKEESDEELVVKKVSDEIKVVFRCKGYPDEEIIIPAFKKTANNILNRGIIFYGPTGSGKTTIIRNFMFLTKKTFPIVFAFAPTNSEKHDMDAMIPKPLVYETGWGLKEIKDIYTRQRSATEIYNNANNLKTLHKLFVRVANAHARKFLGKILSLKQRAIKDVMKKNDSLADQKNKIAEIEDVFKEKLIKFYKQVINPNARKLERESLDQEEKFALRYRNLNVRSLMVFDDAMTEILALIKAGKKANDETIKNFFFKGRHANISHWYAFQDDKGLDTDIRKNAHISVFTDKQVALAYFSRAANSFSAQEKKRAEAVINTIFDEDKCSKYAKLVYYRLDKHKFQYIIADEYEDKEVQMCSKPVRDFCKKVELKGENFDKSNPYFQKFAEQL